MQTADGWLETPLDLSGKRVWVTGHNGLVGSAMVRHLKEEGVKTLVAPRRDVDLRDQRAVNEWVLENKPDIVVMAGAKVGGIKANSEQPADFLYDNMMIEANVIHAAHKHGVQKLLFLGSSCIYPREAEQPIREKSLLTGPLEPTNEAYAIAKIAGIKLCQSYRAQHGADFISAMPCNLYGPGDAFEKLEGAHVIPGLIMKAHHAKVNKADAIRAWGTGRPLREFLYVDDLADALVFLLKRYSSAEPINVGSGKEISIATLAHKICNVVGFEGRVIFDSSQPDGCPRKLMDSFRIREAGWKPSIDINQGLQETYRSYRNALQQKTAA